MAKNPIFPVYYNDLTSSTIDWSDEEFGAYVRLLIYQWDKGFIPSEMKRLLKIADSAEKNWTVLCKKFTPDEQGFLKNAVMEKIRLERNRFLKHQYENGILGGRPKVTQLKTQTKPKKKPLEDEIEEEKELEIKMPFTQKFFSVWCDWKLYRRNEFSKKFKSAKTEQAALNHLSKIAENNEETAIEIISNSMANQWQGLFPLKQDHGSKSNSNGNGAHKPGTSEARVTALKQWGA